MSPWEFAAFGAAYGGQRGPVASPERPERPFGLVNKGLGEKLWLKYGFGLEKCLWQS